MKKLVSIVCLCLMVFAGCKRPEKDVYNYYPKVKTMGVNVLPDGTLRVEGKLLSSGAGDLQAVGFCLDSIPGVNMLRNQVICDSIVDNTFYADYKGLHAQKKYYLRAWAANENGYTYGEEIAVLNTGMDSSLLPCSPDMNTIYLENSGHAPHGLNMGTFDPGFNWDIDGYSSFHSIMMTFGSEPVTGVYKTVEQSPSGGSKTVYIVVGTSLVKFGAEVYVRELSTTAVEVTICEAPVGNWSNGKLTLRFVATKP